MRRRTTEINFLNATCRYERNEDNIRNYGNCLQYETMLEVWDLRFS
jgi:hypothetical protein